MPQNIWSDGTIEVVGTVTKEPEAKLVGEKETLIVNFNIAISRWKEENQSYCYCSAFGKVANAILDMKKGDIVHAIGKYKKRSYTDRNGADQVKKNLVCDFVSILKKNEKNYGYNNNQNKMEEKVNLETSINNTNEEIISVLDDSADLLF